MKKPVTIILIALFVCLTILPYPVWQFMAPFFDEALNEKRELAEKPAFSMENLSTFPGQYENYIDDHVPFRTAMLRTYSTWEYRLFHSSTAYKTVVGKGGWIFYTNRDDGNPVGIYKGFYMLTEEQLETVKQNLLTTRDHLEKDGIEFVLFVMPLKERLYSEYMPDLYGAPAEPYAMRQVVEYLQEYTDLRVVDATEALFAAKRELGDSALLYHKTDSHWNELGAYIGTCELLKELGIAMPAYNGGNTEIIIQPDIAGDMAYIANLEKEIEPGWDYTVNGYDTHELTFEGGDFYDTMVFRSTGADDRRVLLYHDSFAEAMETVFCSQFNESILVHRLAFQPELIDMYQPDVFVMEIAERSIVGTLWNFVYE